MRVRILLTTKIKRMWSGDPFVKYYLQPNNDFSQHFDRMHKNTCARNFLFVQELNLTFETSKTSRRISLEHEERLLDWSFTISEKTRVRK